MDGKGLTPEQQAELARLTDVARKIVKLMNDEGLNPKQMGIIVKTMSEAFDKTVEKYRQEYEESNDKRKG